MILEFSVGNFRSFKEKVTFSALADTKIRSFNDNVFNYDKISILRTSVIYGPNACGKSNLAKAYYAMLVILRESFQNTKILSTVIEPFLLDSKQKHKPTFFELSFLMMKDEGVVYRLGFEITDNKVSREWLFRKSLAPKSREIPVYERENQDITAGQSLPDKAVVNIIKNQNLLREDSLLFSLLESLNNSLISEINTDFLDKNISASAMFLAENKMIPDSILEDAAIKKAYLYLLRKADTGIEDFKLDEGNILDDSRKVLTGHSVIEDGKEKIEYFEMESMESQGTKKVFNLLGVMLKTLKDGGVLVIDEIDTQLHPHLTNLLFNLFNDNTINLRNAQLVAITHEHSILNHQNIRKDQVWFIQKDEGMVSEMYSLTDFSDERNVHSFAKRYLNGQYGAIPQISDVHFLTDYLFGESDAES